MHKIRLVTFGLLILGLGYALGISQADFQSAVAQDDGGNVSEAAANKIRAAQRALSEARETLMTEGKYEAVTDGANAFLIMAGGGNAREDLESGRGVDPETFAALYAGHAMPEIQDLLDTDEQGRITYNNEVVRMYSKAKLQRIFANRLKITEEGF